MHYSDYNKEKKTGIVFYVCATLALTMGTLCSIVFLLNLIGFVQTII